MKKVILWFLLTFILIGLSGCRTSRATVRTDTDRNTRLTEISDTSRNQQTTSSDQKTAALSSNEQKTVVIEFDEWEYYPPADTDTASYAHISPEITHSTQGEADKPPNAGALKRHKKGTITINGNKETAATTTETSTTETNIQETGSREASLDEAVKEKTSQKTDTERGSKFNAFAFGIVFAFVVFLVLAIYLARRK